MRVMFIHMRVCKHGHVVDIAINRVLPLPLRNHFYIRSIHDHKLMIWKPYCIHIKEALRCLGW